MEAKKNFVAVDIAKLLFAFGVVGLHTGVLLEKSYGFYLHALFFRLGVPYFFVCAGFFLGRKTTQENKSNVLLNYIKKLLPMYLLWNLFYVPYSLYYSGALTWSNLIRGIWYTLTGRSMTVMWFIGCLIWCVLILLAIKNERKLPVILAFFIVLYDVGLLFNTYKFLLVGTRGEFVLQWLTHMFSSNSNFLFCGFFFVGCGYAFAKLGEPFWLVLQRDRLLVIVSSFLLLIGETIIVKGHLDVVVNYEYYLSHLLLVPALFLIVRDLKLPQWRTKPARDLSNYIYCAHFAVFYGVVHLSRILQYPLLQSSLTTYLMVVGLTTLSSLCCIVLKSKRHSLCIANTSTAICVKNEQCDIL